MVKSTLFRSVTVIGIIMATVVFLLVLYFLWKRRKHAVLAKTRTSTKKRPSVHETVPGQEGDETQRKQDKRERKRSHRKREKKANVESGRPKTTGVKNGDDLGELQTDENVLGSVASAAELTQRNVSAK
jgi:hypothetical protein